MGSTPPPPRTFSAPLLPLLACDGGAQDVRSGCHRRQVIGIRAATMRASKATGTGLVAVVAEMVKGAALRDGSDLKFVDQPVDVQDSTATTTGANDAVSGPGVSRTDPFPAPVGSIDQTLVETIAERATFPLPFHQRVTVSPPASVVHVTPAPRGDAALASFDGAIGHVEL